MVSAAAALGILTALASPSVEAQNYVGAARCKSCHEYEFQIWSTGPHASSLESLDESKRQDAKCNTCHTMLPKDSNPRFAGVQCERCHGPGRYYHPEFVMRDQELARAVGLVEPKAEHCQQCHTPGTPQHQTV